MPSRFRAFVITSLVVLSGLAIATAPASTASAHDYPVSSTPSKGGVLTALPANFELTMNEDLLDLAGEGNGFALQIVGPDGLYYGDGCLTVADAVMSTPAALGAPGAYTMRWQIVSADGHAVSDEYPFTWAPSTAVSAATGSVTPPVCGAAPVALPSESASPAASASSGSPAPATSSAPPEPSTSAVPVAATQASDATPLWIGGGVIALAAIVATALIVLERRRAVLERRRAAKP